MARNSTKFHYGWVILTLCFLSVFTAFGFGSSPNGLYLAAVTENMGFSRSLFSIADSCRYIATTVVNLFFGKLIAKYGARKLLTAGFICLTAYCLINASARQLWHFYVGGTLLGIGISWTTISLVSVVIEDWVDGNKGTITGLILASNGLGGALATQVVSKFLYSRPDGWRTSYLVCGLIMAAIGLLGFLFLRNKPSDKDCLPLHVGHGEQKARTNSDWLGVDAHVALRRPYFYLCIFCVFLIAVAINCVGSSSTAHLLDRGIDKTAVVNSVSIGSLVVVLSKTATGVVFDRLGLRLTSLFCQLCTVASIVLLLFVSNGSAAMVYQVVWAIGLPLNTVVLPLIAKECFGLKSYAFLMGLMVSVNSLGSVISPPIMNFIFDTTGTYHSGLIFTLCLMVASTVIMQFVISAAHRERRKTEIAI